MTWGADIATLSFLVVLAVLYEVNGFLELVANVIAVELEYLNCWSNVFDMVSVIVVDYMVWDLTRYQ